MFAPPIIPSAILYLKVQGGKTVKHALVVVYEPASAIESFVKAFHELVKLIGKVEKIFVLIIRTIDWKYSAGEIDLNTGLGHASNKLVQKLLESLALEAALYNKEKRFAISDEDLEKITKMIEEKLTGGALDAAN